MDAFTDLAGGMSCLSTPTGTVVELWGDVDAALRPQVRETLSDVRARTGPIEIDAAAVSFLDSTGLAFILQLYRCGRAEHRDVVLRDPSREVEDLLAMIGMAGRIPVLRTDDRPRYIA